jgi:hypothetical protein
MAAGLGKTPRQQRRSIEHAYSEWVPGGGHGHRKQGRRRRSIGGASWRYGASKRSKSSGRFLSR